LSWLQGEWFKRERQRVHVVVFGEWPALASLSYAAAFKDTISFAVSPTGTTNPHRSSK